jgi:uncharacterized protein YbgA (DUF1722 family)/uncharacterized protein YbbK (DUF523 family)
MRPKILLSKCYFEPVRYNGSIVNDDFINKLKKHIDFISLCPEVEIGLGVPRQKLIVKETKDSKRLFQPDTDKDFTEKIIEFTDKALTYLTEVDGFILKAKSPSCGVGSAKIYRDGAIIGKTYGFFADAIRKRFPYLPLEDEGRLKDKKLRQHFLTRIFAFSELRKILKNPEPKKLVHFHSKYKYLLLTYHQKTLKDLGQLVADGSLPLNEKIEKYKVKFYEAFLQKPTIKRHANTLMHILGHVSRKLSPKEREHLITLINKYSEGQMQIRVIIELLKNLAYSFGSDYKLIKTYLEPYPMELDE